MRNSQLVSTQLSDSQLVSTQLSDCIYNSTDDYTSQYGDWVLGWMTRQSGLSRE